MYMMCLPSFYAWTSQCAKVIQVRGLRGPFYLATNLGITFRNDLWQSCANLIDVPHMGIHQRNFPQPLPLCCDFQLWLGLLNLALSLAL